VELRQLQLAVPVRRPHHGDVTTHAVESDGAVRPASLDLRLALQLKSELGEERDGGIQIVDDDAHVVHSFDHDGSPSSSRGPTWPLVFLGPDTFSAPEACRLPRPASGRYALGPHPGCQAGRGC
jgi:hypothetical protein